MTVSRRKGDPGYCDLLFSRLVRARGHCQRCETTVGPFDTAHIVSRRYSATRCQEDNAWCLCRPCHQLVDAWAHEKIALAEDTIGMDRYWELVGLAQAGPGPARIFWAEERKRLTELCRTRDIDTRWRVPS